MSKVKMFSKLWLLICATQLVIIKGTYDQSYAGIKTRSYHRDAPNAEPQNHQPPQPEEPYVNTQPYNSRPISSYGNRNNGGISLRVPASNSHQYNDGARWQQQPSYPHQQQQPPNTQQADSYQQRELPIHNRDPHVRHSPQSERAESTPSATKHTIPDYQTGCPPEHTGPVPYAYDCRRFVNCWHGRGHIQSCGPGTVFNPETLECDHPDKVVCGPPNANAVNNEINEKQTTLQLNPNQSKYRAGRLLDVSTDNVNSLCPSGVIGLAPHPTDCTKFLNCANGNTHVQSCGPGTAYSISMQVCNFKEQVDCSDRENAGYGGLNSRDGRQHAKPNLEDTQTIENVSKNEEEGDIMCPTGISGHFPYPFDQTKFLNCKLGNTAIQNCLPDTVYSISRSYCDRKENVVHNDHVNYIVTEAQEMSSTIARCPPSTDGIHLYPYHSTKYINCLQGHMWIGTCAPNTVYSLSTQTCRPESEVRNGDRVQNAMEIHYSAETTFSRKAALNYEGQMLDCPQGQGGLYPHPFDCRKYLQCRNGRLTIETCIAGNVFSLSAKHCDPEELVDINEQVQFQFDVGLDRVSKANQNYPNYNQGTVQLVCPLNADGLFLHPFDCTKYLNCRDGQSQVESCTSGTVYSISQRRCINRNQVDAYDRVEYQTEVQHELSTELEQSNNQLLEKTCTPGVIAVYPHPNDNTKYIQCTTGQGMVENCLKGMVFSKTRKHCDYESKVYEYDHGAGVYGHVNHNANGAWPGSTGVTIGGKPAEGHLGAEVQCPPKAEGRHPHPYDCKKFLSCSNGVTHVKECGPGTAWSVEMEVCYFESDVNCDGRTKIHEPTATTTNTEEKVACPPKVNGRFLHPFNAHKFISCINGKTRVQSCPLGGAFSISRKICLAEVEVNGVDRVHYPQDYLTDITSYPNNYVVCPAHTLGYFVYPFDSIQFIACDDGHTEIQKCAAQMVFSISNEECIAANVDESSDHVWLDSDWHGEDNDYSSHETKLEGNSAHTLHSDHSVQSTVCATSESGFHPHPTDCTKYLRCDNGVSYVMDCDPGTAYNVALEVCDFEDEEDHSFRAVGDRNNQAVACPAGFSGSYPHPLDCTKFLQCNIGIANVQECGPGMAWNSKLEVCDLLANLDCSDISGRRAESPTDDSSLGYNTNSNFQPSPPQPNRIGSTNNDDWRPNHQEHNSPSYHRTGYGGPSYGNGLTTPPSRTSSYGNRWSNLDRQSYGSGLTTPPSRTSSYGDRWSNMDRQRPVPIDTGYISESRYNQDYDVQQSLPTYGKELHPNNGPTSWVGTGTAIYGQRPIQSVIYEEGSLTPNRNYTNVTSFATPLAPLSPNAIPASSVIGKVFTNATTNIYYAQPVGSEEKSEEVFDSKEDVQPSARLPFDRNENKYELASRKWIPMPNQVLLPPKRATEQQSDFKGSAPENVNAPASYATPILRQPTNSQPVEPKSISQNTFDSSNLYGGLQPPPPPSPTSQNPLPSAHTYPVRSSPSRPTGRSIDAIESVRAFSTNVAGQPHLLSPPSNVNVYQTEILTSTPATYLLPPALPTLATKSQTPSTTRLRRLHPLLENATVATFSKDPHYSNSYSNIAHANPIKSVELHSPENSETLPMADALRLLLRPYFNRSGTISEDNADTAEAHIMKLTPKQPSISPNKITKVGAENEQEVELILAGEQHSLTAIPTQSGPLESHTEFYSKNTKQESKSNPNWHSRGHSREFHRNHQNLYNRFSEDEHSSPHTHHRHAHNVAFHERHPEMPNPFVTPELPRPVPSSTTNFDSSNTYQPNPYAESPNPSSTTPETPNPFAIPELPRPVPSTTTNFDSSNTNQPNPYPESTNPSITTFELDVRIDCEFDCGNGKCVKSFELCNAIDNCGNRKDEANCEHLGYEVRLTGGNSANMGRIEVKILEKWGYVCDDKFDLRDAEVVCRELGFKLGASEVRGYSYYPPTEVNVSFAMDEVDCRGNETSLRECNFKGWGVSNCGPDEVVGVVCKVPQMKCPNNYWLCSTSQECIPPAFVCDNTPDCADKSDESDNVCNSPIEYRLDGGRSSNEGRLEVRYRGEWGTVCDDDFGLKEAQVICNSMGFFGLPSIAKNLYGPGSGPIWLDQVSCFGNETALDQCNHWTWGEHNCNHTEDVGLKCTVGVPPQKVNIPQADLSKDDTEQIEEDWFYPEELDDVEQFSTDWERRSKAIGAQRRCGHFKDNATDEYAHPEERVVNGSLAKRGHHPWQATIRTRGRGGISSHWCGAVLISSRHVLTAAHCLAGYPKGAYLVRMGDHYANIAESSEIDSFIENWYVHEKFRDATHMNNDIALIMLKTPVKFNDYIQPVCLPNKGASLTENRKCTISGWGSIKSGVSTPSYVLRAAELPILPDDVCTQSHVYGASMTDGMFCAGYMDESVDACDGDSGGPLICHDEDGETLYGIISWGQHCGYANKPGVYVRVEKYIDWILEKINFSMKHLS